MKYETLTITNFGGLNEDENPNAVGDHELTSCLNVWRRGRTIGTRPGTRLDPDHYDAAISGTPNVLGLVDFRRDRGETSNLVAIVPGAIHTSDTVTLDIATNSIVVTNAAEEPWTFAQHKEILFAAGGDVQAGTPDQPWYWDPTHGAGNEIQKLSIPDLSATDRSPRWIFQWENRGFCGGFDDHDASANPGVVRYSALNDLTTWPEANTIGGFSAIGGLSASGSEHLTGAGSYQDNEGKFVNFFTNRGIYPFRLTGNPVSPFQSSDKVDPGVAGPFAYVSLGLDSGDAVFLSEHGVHSLRQSQTFGAREDAFISFKIRETFATINKSALKVATGTYLRENGVIIFAVPTGSSSVNDTLLVLDVRDISSGSQISPGQDITAENARWYVWKFVDVTPNVLVPAQDSNQDFYVYAATNDGRVVQVNPTLSADVGSSYEVTFTTKHHNFGSSMSRKVVNTSMIAIQPAGTYHPTMSVLFDYGDRQRGPYQLHLAPPGATWDSGSWDVDLWAGTDSNALSRIHTVGQGASVAWKFLHQGTSEPFYIAELSAKVAVLGEAGRTAA